MRITRWKLFLGIVSVALATTMNAPPSQAQIRELLEELVRPPAPPPPAEEYRERLPPAPPMDDRRGRWEEIREQMADYRQGCQDGDRRSCIRLGIMIGENRERRTQWRQEHPEYFWWER